MNMESNAPLNGVRVLDLTRVIAGPYCTMQLADMGAEVVKIENPEGGDDARNITPPDFNGESHFYLAYNRHQFRKYIRYQMFGYARYHHNLCIAL